MRNAGQRQTARNKQTGTMTSVYDGEAAGMDTDGGRWQTVCEDHGTICSHETLRTATMFVSIPLEWCEECMKDRPGFLEPGP